MKDKNGANDRIRTDDLLITKYLRLDTNIDFLLDDHLTNSDLSAILPKERQG